MSKQVIKGFTSDKEAVWEDNGLHDEFLHIPLIWKEPGKAYRKPVTITIEVEDE